METLIDSYGLNSSKFLELLKKYKAVISGSSALSLYLGNTFVPNDIDIWIDLGPLYDDNDDIYINYANNYKELYDIISPPFFKFLWRANFEEKELTKTSNEVNSNKIEINADNNYENISVGGNKIYKVIEFINEDSSKKVQLVFIKNIKPIKFINKYFDLSVCKTWYNPETNTLETDDVENTSKKLMYTSYDCNYEDLHQKNKDRIEKYKERGFTLIKNPEEEARNFSKEFTITVEDIIAFDSYNLVEFLKAKQNNIVIKSGESYQAWDRQTYINQCRKFNFCDDRGNSFCSTPLLQTVLFYDIDKQIDNYETFKKFRIFEIVKTDFIITKRGTSIKSNLHKIIPLSVKDFEKKYTVDGRKIETVEEI